MKIALVRKTYSNFGGAERYVASLAEHLVALKHEVHIFANEWKIEKKQDSRLRMHSSQIVFHKIPIINGLSVLEVLSFAINSKQLIKKESFDIIHSFERTIYQDVYRAGDGCHREWLKQRTKIDPWYKLMSNRLNPLHLSLLWIEKKIFEHGNYKIIIANSKRGKDEIIKHYGVPSKKIKVIYNAVDTNRFNLNNPAEIRMKVRNSLGILSKDRVLLFVGSGFKRKGLAATIKSLAKLKSGIKLIVIGKDRVGPYRSIVKRMGIEKHVNFVGPITDVEKYYCAGDLLISPTIYEPFSNVCLEAMASGLPVITSRINGASEVLEKGKNGYIIENPLDPVEIGEKIQRGFKLNRRLVQNFNSELLQQFSWERHLRQLFDIYESITNKNNLYA